MKIVTPPSPAPVQTYPTEDAAKQAAAGAQNRKVLEYVERDEAPVANGQTPPEKPKKYVVVETPAVVDGSELRDAAAVQGRGGERRIPNFVFV